MSRKNTKFINDLKKYIKQQEKTIEQVVKGSVLEVVKVLVERSPVGQPENWTSQVSNAREGYTPGRYISSWNVTLDSVPFVGYNNKVDSSGNPSVINAMTAMRKYNLQVNGIAIVNTAENPDTGEYYPSLLQRKIGSNFPGYNEPLGANFPELTYDYANGLQDDVIGTFSTYSSTEFKLILSKLVKATP